MDFKQFYRQDIPSLVLELNYKEIKDMADAATDKPHGGVPTRGGQRSPVKFQNIDRNGKTEWLTTSLTTEGKETWPQTVKMKDWETELTADDDRSLSQRVRDAGKGDLELHCDCPAFLYWGYKYILTQYDAVYGSGENRRPKVRNPDLEGSVCVHLWEVMKVFPFHFSDFISAVKQNNWFGYE